jgi:hypothetical protein
MRFNLYSRTLRPAARFPRVRAAAVALAAGGVAGCGGGAGADDAPRTPRAALIRAACRGGEEKVLRMAVAEYVRQAKPKPQRFLNAAGTDSALPAAAVSVLQDKGPTYYFSGGAEAQARAMLHEKGDYTTLLLVPRKGRVAERSATVRLAGHYVGGEEDGRPAGERRYAFACDSAGWRMTDKAPERSA